MTLSEVPASPSVGPPALTAEDRDGLLRCARAAIRAATGAGTVEALRTAVSDAAAIRDRGSAFVTLTVDGELRGCMGTLDPDQPIVESVAGAAASAAIRDPRFRPVDASELPGIHLEVSVLGPRVPLHEPLEFRPGIDGIVVERDWQAALLLPDVATELGWDATEMFEAVCRKAGLPRNAWRDAGPGSRTRLYTFRTIRFGGPVSVVPAAADLAAADSAPDPAVSPSRAPR